MQIVDEYTWKLISGGQLVRLMHFLAFWSLRNGDILPETASLNQKWARARSGGCQYLVRLGLRITDTHSHNWPKKNEIGCGFFGGHDVTVIETKWRSVHLPISRILLGRGGGINLGGAGITLIPSRSSEQDAPDCRIQNLGINARPSALPPQARNRSIVA
ncbi:hypothetical protein P691DRAFT_788127 [Macrolepiota fuliginosa MF-IS2]|uniref:Uncharacterized protein n=1 Tax=Macrolepiota fuliginosa MF-IS2 TaxID=1400762 RepID=A0A9P6BWX0_9AGAR|nr:hypothetical protein P691DRAFT_788127 [Macrolepiota fuliginosa MF-IS2]